MQDNNGTERGDNANRGAACLVEISSLHRAQQRFEHCRAVTWPALLGLVRGSTSTDEEENVRSALNSIAETCLSGGISPIKKIEAGLDSVQRTLAGVKRELKTLSKPFNNDGLVRTRQPGDASQDYFTRVFKFVPIWKDTNGTFGLALDRKSGALMIVCHRTLEHNGTGSMSIIMETKPNSGPKPGEVARAISDGSVTTRPGGQTPPPRLGQLETLAEYREVIKRGVRTKGWRDEELDAPIRNQMLFIDQETSSVASVLSDDPTVRDEPLMTLVKRMSQWKQCLRFLHRSGTLLGYVSGAPLRDEGTLKSRDLHRHDLNLLREDVWWGAGESEDASPPTAFCFSSIRLLDRDQDNEFQNRRELMRAVESILLELARREQLFFERIYVCVHQAHVKWACRSMIEKEKHGKLEAMARARSYPLLTREESLRGLKRMHLSPTWCIADGFMSELKACYRNAGRLDEGSSDGDCKRT
ncbi:MAG: hypothetical protein JNM86_09120 [Phycisphaerae bacterium]|nr:hypothetical protein [Phycisphaerae bacterium]